MGFCEHGNETLSSIKAGNNDVDEDNDDDDDDDSSSNREKNMSKCKATSFVSLFAYLKALIQLKILYSIE
jgi:hypothetical protein